MNFLSQSTPENVNTVENILSSVKLQNWLIRLQCNVMRKWLINASNATDWTPELKLEQSSLENQKMLKENRMKKKLLKEQALRGLTMSVHFTNPIFFLEIKNAQHIFLFQWTIDTHRYNKYNYSRYISSGYVWFRDLFWMQ